MDPIFLLIAAVPLTVAILGKIFLYEHIKWQEFAILLVIALATPSIVWGVGRFSSAWDTELWNGSVTDKRMVQRSCPSGWIRYTDDFCTEYRTRSVQEGQTCFSDSKGNQTCTPNYVTEYNYDYPWERKYPVSTNIDITYWIARVDPQGAREPPRFTQIRVGEPVTKTNSYNNWVKAASDSLFHEDGAAEEKYLKRLPAYPGRVYDYYHVDRVLGLGVDVPLQVQAQLEEALKQLGPAKQMNAIVVAVDATQYGDDFPYAVRRHWQGFKKNDAVVFLGLREGNVEWANVMSWSKRSLFDVELREALLAQRGQPVNFTRAIGDLQTIGMAQYERRSMKEFEFLKDQIPVPVWLTVLALVLSLGGTTFALWFFHRNSMDQINIMRRIRR